MDDLILSHLIKQHLLNDRRVSANFRKQTGLNKCCLEVLAYSVHNTSFTIYQALQYYPSTNVQLLRRSVKMLTNLKFVELIGYNGKSRAAVYMVTDIGIGIYKMYLTGWMNILQPSLVY